MLFPRFVGGIVSVMRLRCLVHSNVSGFGVGVLVGLFTSLGVPSYPPQCRSARVGLSDRFPYIPVWLPPLFFVFLVLVFEKPFYGALVVHGC